MAQKLEQRGISFEEVQRVLETGKEAVAHSDRKGKVAVFPYNAYRRGRWFEEKEVRVIYREDPDGWLFVFTAIARYGRFS
ncbi:MAG: DUF4258 domain-containing protein [Chloroflexi bacterium]|nr:DUF4258 domain-containing protein [Chloroflexota bacterium]